MAQFEIILQRKKEYFKVRKMPKDAKVYKEEDSTIGELKILNQDKSVIFECFTCENIGPSTRESGKDRRILPREYKLEWTQSQVALPKEYKPKCITTICEADAEHKGRRIHIHIGNYPQDTEGCILLGKNDNKNGTIAKSTDAVNEFYNIVSKNGIENFTLFVKEIE